MKFIYLLIALFFSFQLFAQESFKDLPPKFQNLKLKDGLSNLAVHSMCQDDLGYIWIGTARGLNRYDGISFEHFYYNDDDNSLFHDNIIEVHKGPEGNIFCRTTSGINVFKIVEDKLVKMHSIFSWNHSFANYNNNVYSTKQSKGLYRYNANSRDMVQIENFPKNDPIDNLLSDEKTGIWAKSSNNRFIINYNPTTDNYKKYLLPNSDTLTTEGNLSLINNHLIISTTNDIAIFDIVEEKFKNINEKFERLSTIRNQTINFIIEVEKDVLWIGTKTNGLYIYNLQNQSLQNLRKSSTPNTLNSNHLTCCFKDTNNNIWLGTFDRGINVVFQNRRNFNFDLDLHQLTKDKFVTSICTDNKHNYYIGTRLNGLYIYNSKTKETSILNENNSFISDNNIRSLMYSSNNKLWISSSKQLYIFDVKSGEHTIIDLPKPHRGIVNFCETDDFVFCGSDMQGLLVFSQAGDLIDTKKQFNTNVTQILERKDGKLVIAAHSIGCFIYDYKTNKAQSLSDIIGPSAIKNYGEIITIYIDKKDNLWIGNFKYGLYRISQDGKEIRIFNMKNGLPSNDITGIVEDDLGNIWISTAYGLSMLDKHEDFTNYSYNEGLENIQFHQKSVLKDQEGTIYFGGNFGLTFFNPKTFNFLEKQAPKIILETLKVSNQRITPNDKTRILTKNLAFTDQITLTHHHKHFSIEYKGFDYASAKNMKYAYILERSDEEWNYVDNRTFASYQNLKPGNYRFKVKALNNNGVWSEERVLDVTIKQTPWLSTWAFIAYFIIIQALILIVFRILLNIRNYKREIQFEQNEKQREKEISQMKIRFFTNISHEIRTPVTLIKGNLDLLTSELEERKITIKSLNSLRYSTDRLLKLINQLLSFRQLENDALNLEIKNEKLIELSKKQIEPFLYTGRQKDISIDIVSTEKEIITPLDRDKYEKILNNLLSNSLKFSKPNGKIKVLIEKVASKDLSSDFNINKAISNYIKVSVIDNGKGISANDLPNIFDRYTQYSRNKGKPDYSSTGIGLNFTKRLIELHHGAIIAKSKENVETCFCFILPADEQFYPSVNKSLLDNIETSMPLAEIEMEEADTDKPDKVILIAEDDIELNQYIQNAFSKTYKVIPTYNGKEALEMASKILPDIIISDIMMPEMDGITLCEKIREDNLISHIPIVLLTAKTEVENKLEGFKFGADEYITKPFHLNVLKIRIQNLIQQRQTLQKYYQQGFQAEKRPNIINPFEKKFMDDINNIIEENYKIVEFNVQLLADKMNMSRTSFYRKFISITDTAPKDYITNYRINKSIEYMHEGYESLGEISFLCGFSSQTIFSNSFRKIKGVLPLQYKKNMHKKD